MVISGGVFPCACVAMSVVIGQYLGVLDACYICGD